MKKHKVLFLTPMLPYPPLSGGLIKSYRVAMELNAKYNLQVANLEKPGDEKYRSTFDALLEAPLISERHHAPRTLMNFIKSILNGVPLSIYRNQSCEFHKLIAHSLSSAQIIIMDHFLMYQYIPSYLHQKVIYHAHNAEYIMWKRMADLETNFIKKVLLNFEAQRIRRYEKRILESVKVVLSAPNDEILLKQIVSKKRATPHFLPTWHLGDDQALKLVVPDFECRKDELLFVSTLSWEANRDAILWFLENVFPLIEHAISKIHIVGKGGDGLFSKFSSSKICYHGFLEDKILMELYKSSKVFIAPLRFGSGIKVKVIDALYKGIPVVTTSVGVEGIELLNDQEIVIRERPDEMAQAVINLLVNREYWSSIAKRGREKAASSYSWNRVFQYLHKAIDMI